MVPIRFRMAQLMRPFILMLPRGRWRLCAALLGELSRSEGNSALKSLHRRDRVFFDSVIGCYVVVDLADWAGRKHWFSGYYSERDVQFVVAHVLGRGGTFVDVGANRGLHTLFAAKILERNDGLVYAFEPNPQTARMLNAHLAMNRVENCRVFNMGLGDAPAELKLNAFVDGSSGTCSFLENQEVAATFTVAVARMDHVSGLTFRGPTVVKIDTEGFEYHVLSGMGDLLDYPNLTIILECTPGWLARAGASAEQLFALMRQHRFEAYRPHVNARGKLKLSLEKLGGPIEGNAQYNVVFSRDDV